VIVGVLFAGLLGAIEPNNRVIRWSAFALWAYSAVKGMLLAIEHVDYQLNPSPFNTCDFFPNFPTWAPLHQWLPWMFNPTGDCSDVSWTMLSYSMPQWLIFAFALYLVTFAIVMVSGFITPRK
jgi:disulfide bond formation protein DsbB